MRKETIPTFEQTKEISYLSTLFDLIEQGRARVRALEDNKRSAKENQKVLAEEIKKVHARLNELQMTDYMIQKYIDKSHRYKFIYFLRTNGKFDK